MQCLFYIKETIFLIHQKLINKQNMHENFTKGLIKPESRE